MSLRLPSSFAFAALAAVTLVTPASAGGCCACNPNCAPPAVVLEPGYVKPIYIVDQGPVYSGPGIVTMPRIKPFNRPLADYPYMVQEYDYGGRAYHRQHRYHHRHYR